MSIKFKETTPLLQKSLPTVPTISTSSPSTKKPLPSQTWPNVDTTTTTSRTETQSPLRRPSQAQTWPLKGHYPYAQDPRTPNPRSVPPSADKTIKRLIVCADGTWKSSDQGPPSIPSNVTRFARALDCVDRHTIKGIEIQQIVNYQSGLGSGDLTTFQSLAAGSVGFGLDNSVREAYAFLAANYQDSYKDQPADEIYLFGFSRGAYTVRALAAFISQIGLLTKRGMDDFAVIYGEYKKGPIAFEEFTNRRIEENPDGIPWETQRNITIKVVGVFDTVGSVGFPDNWITRRFGLNQRFGFYSTKLSPAIENAFHALALDERRGNFKPTLWYLDPLREGESGFKMKLPRTNTLPQREPKNVDINLIQCWFPGVHSNVGGGYPDHEIADITLAWMIDHCQKFLRFDWSYLEPICANTEIPTILYDQLGNAIDDGEKKSLTARHFKRQKGWAMGTIYDSRHGFWVLAEGADRKPGRYELPGVTREFVHSSVRERYLHDKEYRERCGALKGMELVEREDGVWIWKTKDSKGKEVILEEDGIGRVGMMTGRSMEMMLKHERAK